MFFIWEMEDMKWWRIIESDRLIFYLPSGDLPKQVKVKKLSKLKTLDTKPGNVTEQYQVIWWYKWYYIWSCVTCVFIGIYTTYKTFLHKDKILIKRLLKVKQQCLFNRSQQETWRHVLSLSVCFCREFRGRDHRRCRAPSWGDTC